MSLPPSPQPTPPRPNPPTMEIPVAPPAGSATTQMLPSSAGPDAGPTPISAPLPPPPAPSAPEPTGPVDFVPGLPGAGATAAAPSKKAREPHDRTTLAGLGLVTAAVLLLEVGLLLDFGGAHSFWGTVPLWSGFATVAALLGVLAFAGRHPKGGQLRNDRAWKLAVAGLTGLAVFWVLVVLPVANTDRGFVLTAALGCLGAALWIAPGRRA